MLPSRNACIARQVSGRASSSSVVTALSRKPTTIPESSSREVCTTPRDNASVSAVAIPAPTVAAAVTPISPAQASVPIEASAATRLKVTPSAAPDAVPRR